MERHLGRRFLPPPETAGRLRAHCRHRKDLATPRRQHIARWIRDCFQL